MNKNISKNKFFLNSKKNLIVIIGIFFICVISFFIKLAMANLENKFLLKNNKTLILIGQDKESIDEYIDSVSLVPSGFMVYTSIQNMDGLFYESKNYGAGINYANYHIQKHPNTVIQLGLYMVGALEDVLNGKYNQNIKKLATWITEADIPVYLRIGYEFDGQHNNYDSEKYKKVYKYIVEMLNAQNINNVSYVWHSQGFLNEDKDIMDWYPGDEYVDWFGISYFHLYHEQDRIFIALLAKKHNKPLMIAEATPYGFDIKDGEKIWTRWFKRVFQFIEKHEVGMFCYINTNWDEQRMWKGQGWGDTRIQQNNYIKNKWLKEMQKPKYYHSPSNFLNNKKVILE
ncbi:hypothetical protein MNBD_UNCLBAC01-499 [hydrothermal vent metagenome]|uniref:GH26 domain-containing protein n=1 Tax=hydrothermal vent metagenome TaxID=652676 RepID=A0A3B1D0N0_9ZZZZ